MSDSPINPGAEPIDLKTDPNVNYFAMTNFRNQFRKFGVKIDDRRRHMYVIGKTGMGKTTLLENMVLNDIYAGHGVGLVDPHGDFAEKIINFIPPHRINDVVYFNPADIDYPIGFNILETIRPEQKHLVVSGLMAVFKKIWPDVWSARMEYILNNTILALIDFPGSTLLGINRMLADEEYRKRVVNNTQDPVVKAFWQTEFASYTDKFRTEAVSPIQNKIGQFLSASVIRNIVAQVKSRINIREIMDQQKIFIINLSKGRIGEDNSRLLGGMLINRLQLAAMERVDIPEKDRKDFFLYVDEFQNFATESFANILSEARKYRLDLIMAHQYMEQLDEIVRAAVIGNVGTMVIFRVGSTDADILVKEFTPTFTEEDLVNLPKFQIYLKLMIDGVASRPFSATTLGPLASVTNSTEKVVRVSRERYAVPRDKIEDKIMRWSGMLPAEGMEDAIMTEEEKDEADKLERVAPAKPAAVVSQPKVEAKPEPAPAVRAPQATTVQPTIIRNVPPATAQSAPQNRPTPQPGSRPASAQPMSGNSGQQSGSLGQGGDGQKKKRKRKRGKGGGGGASLPPGTGGEAVFLVDPSQRGMSLSQLQSNTKPPSSRAEPARSQQKNSDDFGPTPLMLDDEPAAPVAPTAPVGGPAAIEPRPEPVRQDVSGVPSSPNEVKPPVVLENKTSAAGWLVTDGSLDNAVRQPLAQQQPATPKPVEATAPLPPPPVSSVQNLAKPLEPPSITRPISSPPTPVQPPAPASRPKPIQPGRVVKLDE